MNAIANILYTGVSNIIMRTVYSSPRKSFVANYCNHCLHWEPLRRAKYFQSRLSPSPAQENSMGIIQSYVPGLLDRSIYRTNNSRFKPEAKLTANKLHREPLRGALIKKNTTLTRSLIFHEYAHYETLLGTSVSMCRSLPQLASSVPSRRGLSPNC